MSRDRPNDALPPDAWSDMPDPLLAAQLPAVGGVKAPTDKAATRSQARVRRTAALGAAAMWPIIVFAWYGGSWRGHGLDFVALQFAFWSACLVVAVRFALSTGAHGLGQPVRWVRLLAIGAPIAFMALALMWLPLFAKSAFGDLGPAAMLEGCFTIGLQVAAPMVLLSIWGVRKSFPSGAVWRGALLGAACGLGGVLVLVLLCGSPFGGHIALAHGTPLVLATIAGALAGSKHGRV